MEFNSSIYWENRYAKGGNSGSGSRGNLAVFKAKIINDFISEKNIKSIVDLGCGDGHMLMMYDSSPKYIGQDISITIIDNMKKIFYDEFYVYPYPIKAELGLSIDVLFHITNYDEFIEYIKNLFNWSEKYVIIYAFDEDRSEFQSHYKPRKFTTVIEELCPDWELKNIIKNEYPVSEFGLAIGSYSDFYIYEKTIG